MSNIAEINKKGSITDKVAITKEKLKGDFKLRLNGQLDMHIKIGRYAQEPVAFHLHKQRNFIKKLELQIQEEKKNKEERQKVE